MANAQSRRRINLLDFLLIILIIAIVSAAIVSVIRTNPNRISGGDTTISYTIKCDMLDKNAALNIKKGDKIYDNDSNQLLGTVAEDPSFVELEAFDGYQNIATGKVTMKLVVSAQVWKNKGIYSVDNYRIAEGIEIAFHSAEFSYTGLCVLVTEK